MLLQAPVPLEEKAARQPDDVNTLALVLATDHQPANRTVSPLDGDRVLRYDVCQASQDRPRLGCREVLSKLLYEVVGPRVPQAPGNPIGMLAQGGVVDGLEKPGGQFLMHCDQLTMDRALDATQQPEQDCDVVLFCHGEAMCPQTACLQKAYPPSSGTPARDRCGLPRSL